MSMKIDLTPTWGEWGNVYRRFAESGERKAIVHLRKDFARAMAACQALKELELTEAQQALADEVMKREMAKQGFTDFGG